MDDIKPSPLVNPPIPQERISQLVTLHAILPFLFQYYQ